jgi:tetratricopeptide (TPR) repeat protein
VTAPPEWQNVATLIQGGNVDAARQALRTQMDTNPSLRGMLAAVAACDRAKLNDPTVTALRSQTLDLARKHIRDGTTEPLAHVALAKLSLDAGNTTQFRQAADTLLERFPNNEYAHYYAGIRQLQDGEWKAAEASLRRARDLGMPEESLAELLKVAIDNQAWIWEYATATLVIVACWGLGLVLLFAAGRMLSTLTLRSLQRSGPEVVSAGQRRLRTAYRWCINLAGLFYFLSLPIVVLIAVALPLSLGYALLMVPVLNLALVAVVLILGVGGVLTALSGVRAAFVRLNGADIGRAVTEAECPLLWQEVREVADRVGTRCVDEVRLVPSADIAVVERGGFLDQLRDRGRRVLILGLGALQGLKRDSLRCILAHEYGHFQNRDTAGGHIALRVNVAMRNFADAIVRRGKIRWWDVAVQFLRLYHRLFARLTFGASRLQEVLADRVAVRCYGREALVDGLTHVIRRSVEFEVVVNRAVREALRGPQTGLAFYRPEVPVPLAEREQIEAAVRKLLERPTDENDSHPSPGDRFELAAHVGAEERPLSDVLAWELFDGADGVLADVRNQVEQWVGKMAGEVQKIQRQLLTRLSAGLSFGPHPQAYFERARIYLTLGEYAKAVADLTEILNRVPGAVELLYLRGLAYKHQSEHGPAVADLEKCAGRLDGQAPGEVVGAIYLALGECQALLGRPLDAITSFGRVLERNPTSLVALVERGRAQLAVGDVEPALESFTAAITHWPGSPEAYRERAALHAVAGRPILADLDRRTAVQLEVQMPAPLVEAVEPLVPVET